MFQYTNGLSFKLRGTPARGAVLNNNMIPKSESESVHQNETGMVLGQGAQANTFNADTFGQYGVCDFDGDGKDDLFLATGLNWWYMSDARRQWTFLRASNLRLDQVGLGDFDGDGRCDVLSVQGAGLDLGIYRGGTAEWKYQYISGLPFDQLRFGHCGGTSRSDIFRRAPDGQWSLVVPGGTSTPLWSSSLPLSALRFGDFNNDRITDVIAVVDGHWSVSWGGRSAWQPLNAMLGDSLDSVMIGDVDGSGADDIVRYVHDSTLHGHWDVSWQGRTAWQPLASMDWPTSVAPADPYPAYTVRSLLGRFNDAPGADLLTVDFTRIGRVFNRATDSFVTHSDYAY